MKEIIEKFIKESVVDKIEPYGSGFINDTYRVFNKNNEDKDYLLQRINHEIFKNPEVLMQNIEAVTDHIDSKIQGNSEFQDTSETLKIVKTNKGSNYYIDTSGNYWRVFEFLHGYKSYDYVETSEQAYFGAKAFGQFMMLLDDFPMSTIKESIPDFHNIISRLHAFENAIEIGDQRRVKECDLDIRFIRSVAEQMCTIENLRKAGKIRDRVTHNDTKFNNVLLSSDNKKSCVIDLDTVMPGVVHYDFGDGIRTSTSTSAEDEADLSIVQFDLEKFEGFATGYLEMTRDILDPIEIEHLSLSGPLLSYIMGVRFLTDYLSGDHYYKTNYEGHNVVRARCQLEFTKRMLERMKDMDAILKGSKVKQY